MTDKLTIIKPFDAHVHLRGGDMMRDVLPYTARQFSGGVCMGNLPGEQVIDTLEKRDAYLQEIRALAPDFNAIVPLMVTKDLLGKKGAVREALDRGVRVFKFIPGGLTTNGAEGLTLYDFYTRAFYHFFHALETYGAIFSCHFEVGTDNLSGDVPIDPRGQEEASIHFLQYLLGAFPRLKIVVEHASTQAMLDFIEGLHARYHIAATLTLHHANISYDHVCKGDGRIHRPELYCKPICKTSQDIDAVRRAMCGGNPRFFAGTDSAPHLLEAKLREKNPAPGIFSAPVAMQGYAKIFDIYGHLEYLENFVSVFSRRFYGIEPGQETITLVRKYESVPEMLCGIPAFLGGTETSWSIAD